MANEINIVSSHENTGWTVYAVIFSLDWLGTATALDTSHRVWNGTAFVTDSWADRNAGAVVCSETSTAGTYNGSFPTGITQRGSYPVTAYRRLGGSYNSQTDTPLLPDGNTVSIAGTPTSLSLLHSPAQIIQQAMIDMGEGTDGALNNAWPIFATEEPDDPDNCVTVYDTQGTDDGRTMTDGKAGVHHGIQVRVRAYDHSTGYVKAKAIRNDFETVLNRQVSLDSQLYLVECITKIGDVLPLGQDAPNSKRRAFTLNVTTPLTRLL